jgi:alkylmercury lyase
MADFLEGIDEFLNTFSAEELAVTREAFRAILNGEPAGVERLATALHLPLTVVNAAVARLVERGTMALDPATGEVVAARGLSLAKTVHRLAIAGRLLYTFCAVDAVGIPAGLERDARVESRCHGCGQPLTLTITKGVVTEPFDGIVIWGAERDPTRSLHTYT